MNQPCRAVVYWLHRRGDAVCSVVLVRRIHRRSNIVEPCHDSLARSSDEESVPKQTSRYTEVALGWELLATPLLDAPSDVSDSTSRESEEKAQRDVALGALAMTKRLMCFKCARHLPLRCVRSSGPRRNTSLLSNTLQDCADLIGPYETTWILMESNYAFAIINCKSSDITKAVLGPKPKYRMHK